MILLVIVLGWQTFQLNRHCGWIFELGCLAPCVVHFERVKERTIEGDDFCSIFQLIATKISCFRRSQNTYLIPVLINIEYVILGHIYLLVALVGNNGKTCFSLFFSAGCCCCRWLAHLLKIPSKTPKPKIIIIVNNPIKAPHFGYLSFPYTMINNAFSSIVLIWWRKSQSHKMQKKKQNEEKYHDNNMKWSLSTFLTYSK